MALADFKLLYEEGEGRWSPSLDLYKEEDTGRLCVEVERPLEYAGPQMVALTRGQVATLMIALQDYLKETA